MHDFAVLGHNILEHLWQDIGTGNIIWAQHTILLLFVNSP